MHTELDNSKGEKQRQKASMPILKPRLFLITVMGFVPAGEGVRERESVAGAPKSAQEMGNGNSMWETAWETLEKSGSRDLFGGLTQ